MADGFAVKGQLKLFFDRHAAHFFRFGTVGAITSGIYFSTMWVGNSLIGLGYISAVSVAYICSTVFHFFANRHFTFRAFDDGHRTQLARYAVMWAMNYVITLIVVHLCVQRLDLSPYIGIFASIILTMLSGYLMSRYWVFKNRSGV